MDRQDTFKMIRELRTDLCLTQEQFAAKLGVTYSTINCWENKKGNPCPLPLLRIEKSQKNRKEIGVGF